MCRNLRHRSRRLPVRQRALRGATLLTATLALGLMGHDAQAQVDASDWGRIAAPVYGTSESGVYTGAELFAGPMKFDSNYFHGVLPNGSIVKPAGISVQVGMNPLGAALTPDGKFLIVSNDDERDGGMSSLQNATNQGGYSLSVVDTSAMTVVSQISTTGKLFIGLQATGSGPYTVYASGGGDNSIKLFSVSAAGAITGPTTTIAIAPLLSGTAGYVSHYTPSAAFNTKDGNGNLPPVPSGFSRTAGAQITFPVGSALSPDGKFLYVACNGDNSLAVIDTTTNTVVKQAPVGYFPYSVSVSSDGSRVFVSNWGLTEYKFLSPTYDGGSGQLTAIGQNGPVAPDSMFFVPVTDTNTDASRSSSITALTGSGTGVAPMGNLYEGKPLDSLYQVGDTHPSATAIVHGVKEDVLYVTKSNSDSIGLIRLRDNAVLPDLDLSPLHITLKDGHTIHGSYPNAIIVSPDSTRAYVAEAGLNSVAVLNTKFPTKPFLLGRIPTGWYPTGLALSADGNTLYIVNAKGIGEDINPKTDKAGNPNATGVESFSDGNYIFGTVQKVDLTSLHLDKRTVLSYNFKRVSDQKAVDTSVVPLGGAPSAKIKHVIFILHENKTFDSMLGNRSDHFGPFASLTYNNADGSVTTNGQNTGVSINTQALAATFATAVNYYSDSEESDAGHQFSASGTASDYTEKTLLVKSGRGLLVNKNFEPEDYPEGGYIFNNAARNGVTFKDYGALIRIVGTDTGTSKPTTLDDPTSGQAGYPQLQADNFAVTNPLVNKGDVSSATQGLGQTYYMNLPILAVLGTANPTGEPRLDGNYPGYNFNISDQRRAQEFIQDFDRMVTNGTLPQYLYIYQPNDHTGGVQAPNAADVGTSPLQQIADGDVGLGMVVQHLMQSPIYYNSRNGEGSAIFITYDDAQSSLDHIHEHRTPLIVVSPYAKPGYVAKRHYVTASVVKTEELLLGLPPNNYGDLLATDLRDLFQPTYNGITAPAVRRLARYVPSPEGKRIWALVKRLDTSAPDRDSRRLGCLARLSVQADNLHRTAVKKRQLQTRKYQAVQGRLYRLALDVVHTPAPRGSDD